MKRDNYGIECSTCGFIPGQQHRPSNAQGRVSNSNRTTRTSHGSSAARAAPGSRRAARRACRRRRGARPAPTPTAARAESGATRASLGRRRRRRPAPPPTAERRSTWGGHGARAYGTRYVRCAYGWDAYPVRTVRGALGGKLPCASGSARYAEGWCASPVAST